jgi:hypothetical protein
LEKILALNRTRALPVTATDKRHAIAEAMRAMDVKLGIASAVLMVETD